MPTGRIQIAPPSDPGAPFPIRSQEWGNVLWDQSVNVFADPTERNAQWAQPHEGAMSYLLSTQQVSVFANGAWRIVAIEPIRPRGIVVQGPSTVAPAINSVLPINAVLEGPSSWLANNTITLPAGAGGLYLINLTMRYQSPTVAAISAELRNAAGTTYALVVGGLVNPGNPNNYISGSWLRQCTDGDTFRVHHTGNPPTSGNASMHHLSLIRVGDQFAP
jgi:hypothetical protein